MHACRFRSVPLRTPFCDPLCAPPAASSVIRISLPPGGGAIAAIDALRRFRVADAHAERAEERAALVRQLKLTGHMFAFTGHALELGIAEPRMVGAAWDLRTVAAHYRGLDITA